MPPSAITTVLLASWASAAEIDWLSQFGAPEDKTLHVHPSDPSVSISWTGTHAVSQMPSREAWEACDFTGAQALGTMSPVVVPAVSGGVTYLACPQPNHCAWQG